MSKSFLAGLLLSAAFAPHAFAGFEFVAPVAPMAASQQAKPSNLVADVPQTTTTTATPQSNMALPPLSPVASSNKLNNLVKPAAKANNLVSVVKPHESDALLLSDEALAQPPQVAPALPPITTATKAPEKAPAQSKVTAGAALPPVVQPDKPTPQASATVTVAPAKYQVAQGFGKQVPLALALRQIVPAEYRFSFAQGVNAGQLVDWQGGAPWDQVVSRVAQENALLVRVNNQVVLIENDPNGVKAPVLNSAMPQSIVPTLPPLNDTLPASKKPAPAFAGDSPLVIALGETLPTSSTADMSLTQPRPSFAPVVPKAQPLSAAALPPVSAPSKTLAPALPTALTVPPVKQDVVLAQKAAEPSLAPVKAPAPKDAALPATLPAALPPLPKARTIEVAQNVTSSTTSQTDDLNKKALAPVAEKPAATKVAAAPSLPPLLPTPVQKPVEKTALALKTAPKTLPPIDKEEVIAAAPAVTASNGPKVVEATQGVPQTWIAEKGQTLRQAFATWSKDAGVTLIWSAAYDYPLQTDVAVNGTFQDAVRTMLDGFSNAQPRPIGRLHKNGATGNAVLVVETRQATE